MKRINITIEVEDIDYPALRRGLDNTVAAGENAAWRISLQTGGHSFSPAVVAYTEGPHKPSSYVVRHTVPVYVYVEDGRITRVVGDDEKLSEPQKIVSTG